MQFRYSQRWHAPAVLCAAALVVSCAKGGDVTGPSEANRIDSGNATVLAWRPMDSGTTELLWGVSGDDDDVIAVGTRGTAIHLDDDDNWVGKPTFVSVDLCDVWSEDDDDAVSVGTFGTIIRYDDDAWGPMTSGTDRNLYDVWGFEEYQVIAVGDSGLILEYDGTGWSPMASITDVSLFGSWGSSPSDLFAVGVGGTIVHYDGTAWSFMETPTSQNLSAVWGTSPHNVWAVGDAGTIIRYNGTAWSLVDEGGTNLYDVWGSGPADIWAVGKGGVILHYNGAAWSPAESGTDRDLFGVWGTAPDDVYAVGADGTVLHYGPEDDDDASIFVLHDHPRGMLLPPAYGLRLDNLLGDGRWTFSFDYSNGTHDSYVTLTHDPSAGTIRIAGRAYGGKVKDNAWASSSRGWIDIDFTYAVNVAVQDDCGLLEGDDMYVTAENGANTGTIRLVGWGGSQTFTFTDRSGENGGCSFVFDNDEDSKGDETIANDPDIWSGSGWLQPGADGSRDWIFTGERVTTR